MCPTAKKKKIREKSVQKKEGFAFFLLILLPRERKPTEVTTLTMYVSQRVVFYYFLYSGCDVGYETR